LFLSLLPRSALLYVFPLVLPSASPLALLSFLFLFLNDPPPPELSPLSLHDALPICPHAGCSLRPPCVQLSGLGLDRPESWTHGRSEEHTSELQSLTNLVCRLLLEKKKNKHTRHDVCSSNIDTHLRGSAWSQY